MLKNSGRRINIMKIMIWTPCSPLLRKAYQRKHIRRSSEIPIMIAGVKQVARIDYRNNYFSRMTR